MRTATANVTRKIVKPTYNEDGKTVYTATVTFGGKWDTSNLNAREFEVTVK